MNQPSMMPTKKDPASWRVRWRVRVWVRAHAQRPISSPVLNESVAALH